MKNEEIRDILTSNPMVDDVSKEGNDILEMVTKQWNYSLDNLDLEYY